MEDRIRRDYVTPSHPIAFSAPGAVARHYGIAEARAREILEHLQPYVLHREYKKPRRYNPYFVYRKRALIQADLIDIRDLARRNRGVTFLLLIVDCFTRKIWVYPLRDKGGETVRAALEEWLGELGERGKPRAFASDAGREFYNARVSGLLRERGIEQELAHGTCKAAFAERANKTLQILIYKYLTHVDTYAYLDQLPDLVLTYNTRPSRALDGLSPNEAELPENHPRVRAAAVERWSRLKRRQPKLSVGDQVRIKIDARAVDRAGRAYAQQFKGEYFKVVGVNRRLPIPLYYIESEDTGERLKEGFYSEELQRTRGDVYQVERVLRTRRRGRLRESLVKWKYFGDRWNQWIPTARLQRLGAGVVAGGDPPGRPRRRAT